MTFISNGMAAVVKTTANPITYLCVTLLAMNIKICTMVHIKMKQEQTILMKVGCIAIILMVFTVKFYIGLLYTNK